MVLAPSLDLIPDIQPFTIIVRRIQQWLLRRLDHRCELMDNRNARIQEVWTEQVTPNHGSVVLNNPLRTCWTRTAYLTKIHRPCTGVG